MLTTNNKIREEESKIRGRTDFEESLTAINQHTERVLRQDEERKCGKVKQLVRTRKRKRTRHKTNLQLPSENHTVQNTNTVVNLLQIPVSKHEVRLLSKSLPFFPKPSRFNYFQLKKDFKDFIRHVRLRE